MQTTEHAESSTELVKSGLVVAQATADQMKKAVQIYQGLVKELLDDDDYSTIKEKKFIRKSGWQKLAVPFNISTEIIEERKEDLKDGKFAYHVKVRASAPNGRYVEKLGSCDNIEKDGATHHIVRTMAETRATSRSIAGLMGVAEQPAEDMEAAHEHEQKTKTTSAVCQCTFDRMKLAENNHSCATCGKELTVKQIDALKKRTP